MRLSEFLLTVLILELTPGPNMGYLAALSLSHGKRAGLLATAGVALGLLTHAVLAALGAGALIQNYPSLYETIRWAGVAYLFWLAYEGWREGAENSPANARIGMDRLFARGFLSNIFNPKSILFFVAVVPGFLAAGGPGSPVMQMAVLGGLYVFVATAVHSAIVLLAASLAPYLVGKDQKLVRRVLSVGLAGLAVWFAFSTARV